MEETQTILKRLRKAHQLSQEELARRVGVTRRAVSRWETGESRPSTDSLRQLSKVLDVSVNTLLGSPRSLICQCCAMPMPDDALLSREPDGSINEDYCKWCYADGAFAYPSRDALLDYLLAHMPNPEGLPEDVRRSQYDGWLRQLKHWQ